MAILNHATDPFPFLHRRKVILEKGRLQPVSYSECALWSVRSALSLCLALIWSQLRFQNVVFPYALIW